MAVTAVEHNLQKRHEQTDTEQEKEKERRDSKSDQESFVQCKGITLKSPTYTAVPNGRLRHEYCLSKVTDRVFVAAHLHLRLARHQIVRDTGFFLRSHNRSRSRGGNSDRGRCFNIRQHLQLVFTLQRECGSHCNRHGAMEVRVLYNAHTEV